MHCREGEMQAWACRIHLLSCSHVMNRAQASHERLALQQEFPEPTMSLFRVTYSSRKWSVVVQFQVHAPSRAFQAGISIWLATIFWSSCPRSMEWVSEGACKIAQTSHEPVHLLLTLFRLESSYRGSMHIGAFPFLSSIEFQREHATSDSFDMHTHLLSSIELRREHATSDSFNLRMPFLSKTIFRHLDYSQSILITNMTASFKISIAGPRDAPVHEALFQREIPTRLSTFSPLLTHSSLVAEIYIEVQLLNDQRMVRRNNT